MKTALNLFLLFIAIVSLSACELLNKDDPKETALRYWQAMSQNDAAAAQDQATPTSGDTVQLLVKLAGNSDAQISQAEIASDKLMLLAVLQVTDGSNTEQVEVITFMEKQGDKWRVDANKTVMPELQRNKDKELSEVGDEMSQTLREAAELFGKAMQEGAQDMKESMIENMKQMNKTMRDTLDKSKGEEAQPQEPTPVPAPAE